MPTPPECYAIIPARYDSSRFPGKPLAPILGKPMFWHVYERVRACPGLINIHVATDDERILGAAREFGIPALMTDRGHESGTDRIYEAAQRLGLQDDAVVVNVQGDEPTLDPGMLSQLLEVFQDEKVEVSTLMRRITAEEAANTNIVKVVVSHRGKALYFSRAVVPHQRGQGKALYWGHIGLYAYRSQVLKQFHRFGPSPLEKMERLEQLRLLEAGIPIDVRPTDGISHGVDRPEDIPVVEKILAEERKHAGNSCP